MGRLGVKVGKVILVFRHLHKVAAFYLATDGKDVTEWETAWTLEPGCLGWSPGTDISQLCDLGQGSSLPCASVSLSVKGGS